MRFQKRDGSVTEHLFHMQKVQSLAPPVKKIQDSGELLYSRADNTHLNRPMVCLSLKKFCEFMSIAKKLFMVGTGFSLTGYGTGYPYILCRS